MPSALNETTAIWLNSRTSNLSLHLSHHLKVTNKFYEAKTIPCNCKKNVSHCHNR